MNPEEFVSAIKMVVEKSTISDIITNLTKLPGKSPDHRLKYLSDWYMDLDEEGKEYIKLIIEEATKTSIFGFFCVLDGVRSIENGPHKGKLILNYCKDDNTAALNDINDEYLHDIYNSE